MVIVITIFFNVPAYAVLDVVIDPGIADIWAVVPDLGSWLWNCYKTGGNAFMGLLDGDNYCPGAETSFNNRHNYASQHTTVDGKTGMFYICQNCGKSAGEVLASAYDTYVESLPATGYDSDGRLRFLLPVKEFVASYGTIITYSEVGPIYSVALKQGSSTNRFVRGYFEPFTAPIAGEYQLCYVFDASADYRLLSNDPTSSNMKPFGSSGSVYGGSGVKKGALPELVGFDVGQTVVGSSLCFSVQGLQSDPSGQATGYWELLCQPYAAPSGDIYNINTRPTSFTGGNYGIVGDNGYIIKVEDNSTIVNETNNTYYNPATGQTGNITDWSYDYSDRSYTLTLEGDKTSTVTYGDENISITETTINESGDTITNNYTIYYLVDGTGAENPPAICDHDWQETDTAPATCTRPGSKILTCSLCQQTKTEPIPALGHNWQVKQTVTTEYDDTGQLVQQGYTIFECSTCGEQYKSQDGTIPPGGSSGEGSDDGSSTTIGSLIEKLLSGLGDVVSGIIKGLLALLTAAVEALAGIVELFTTFVSSLVGLWGGFTEFLSAVFPFLPVEFITIIEFGLILMIFAAVFKRFLG